MKRPRSPGAFCMLKRGASLLGLAVSLAMTVVRLMVLPEGLFVLGSGFASSLTLVIGNLCSGNGLISSALRALGGGDPLISGNLGLLRGSLAFAGQGNGLIGGRLGTLYVCNRSAAAKQCCRNQNDRCFLTHFILLNRFQGAVALR